MKLTIKAAIAAVAVLLLGYRVLDPKQPAMILVAMVATLMMPIGAFLGGWVRERLARPIGWGMVFIAACAMATSVWVDPRATALGFFLALPCSALAFGVYIQLGEL